MTLNLAATPDARRRAPLAGVQNTVPPRTPERVGIVLPNWIGDVVMATPALRALRRDYGPDSQLIGVMNPIAADVLAGTEFVDEIVLYRRRSSAREQRLWSVGSQLRRLDLDTLLLFTNSLSSGWLGFLSRARQRIGYARHGRRLLLTQALPAPRAGVRLQPISAVDYYLQLAYAVGCPEEAPHLQLAVSPADEDAADAVLREIGLDAGPPLVVLNNGGAYGGAKRWPAAHLVGLSRMVVEHTDASVLVVCGPAERSEAALVEREAASPRVRSLAGREPSIVLTKACIARSSVVVSTDSGLRHFAAAFGIPCVTLFGPSDPRWSHNYHANERILQLDLPCSPCGRRTCPLGHHQCLREITAKAVLNEVLKLRDDRSPPEAAVRPKSERRLVAQPCAD